MGNVGDRRVIYIVSIINEGFPKASVVSHSSVQSTVIDIRYILSILIKNKVIIPGLTDRREHFETKEIEGEN